MNSATMAAVTGGLVVACASSAALADTVAYWRFENGVDVSTSAVIPAADGMTLDAANVGDFPAGPFSPNPDVDVIPDVTGNGNDLRSFHAETIGSFSNDVPFATVPSSGAANNFSWDISTPDGPARDLYEVGTGNIRDAMNGSSQYTVEVTFKQTSSAGYQGLVGRDRADGDSGTGPLASFVLGLTPGTDTDGGRIQFYTFNPTGGITITDQGQTGNDFPGVGDPLELDKWYTLVVVGDGTDMTLYLKSEDDSAFEEVYSFVQAGLGTQTGTWTVGRGQFDGAPADPFRGLLDEVRISDSALTPSEFLTSNVPEPTSLGLLALASLAVLRRRH